MQADIFALPFRDETFDVAYSIGVLHHTPDTAGAFRRVAAMVKKGGQLAVYIYLAGGLARYFSDAFRAITTRLPRPLVYYGSAMAIPLYFLHRVPIIGRVSQALIPTNTHPDWRWRWLDTFDWYTPRYQWKHRYPEVLRWFRETGFSDLHVADEPICVRGLKVVEPVSQPARGSARRLPRRRLTSLPIGGLLLFTILLYLRPNELLPIGTFPIVKIITSATLVAFFVERLGQRGPISVMPRPFKYLLAVAGLAILSIPIRSRSGRQLWRLHRSLPENPARLLAHDQRGDLLPSTALVDGGHRAVRRRRRPADSLRVCTGQESRGRLPGCRRARRYLRKPQRSGPGHEFASSDRGRPGA